MDYQASKICCKIRSYLNLKSFSIFISIGIFFPLHVFAQTTTNPLTAEITITATVLETVTVYPDTQPLPPSPGPINMTNTTDLAIFRGTAYPSSVISVLKNGVIIGEVTSNLDGIFEVQVQNLLPGTYSFGIRAEDKNKLTSKLLVFTIYVTGGVVTAVDGIFIPPTITSDKVEVKKGDGVTFFGSTAPNAEVRLSFGDTPELLKKIKANAVGVWKYTLDTHELGLGDFDVKARSLTENNLSPYGDPLLFRIGDTNRSRAKVSELPGFRKRCDLNNDSRVNILDFSIMAFWYKRLGFPHRVDLNSDNSINLTDLSILAYCWTG